MALSQYYNKDRSLMNRWMATKQAAAEGWGNLVGDIGMMGAAKLGKMKQSKLDKGYADYTAGLTEADMDTKLTSDQWEAQSGKDYLKNLRQENKMRNKAEKAHGVKSKGLLGIAQRFMPGGSSGYDAVPEYPNSPMNTQVNSTVGGSTQGGAGPLLNQPSYSGPAVGTGVGVPSSGQTGSYASNNASGGLQGILNQALGVNTTISPLTTNTGQDPIMAILQQVKQQNNAAQQSGLSPQVYNMLLQSKQSRGGI